MILLLVGQALILAKSIGRECTWQSVKVKSYDAQGKIERDQEVEGLTSSSTEDVHGQVEEVGESGGGHPIFTVVWHLVESLKEMEKANRSLAKSFSAERSRFN